MSEVSTASRATAAIAVAVAGAAAARAVASSSASSSSESTFSSIVSGAGAPLAAALVAAVLALTAVRLLFEFAEWARCFYYLGKVRFFLSFFPLSSERELAAPSHSPRKKRRGSSLSLPLLFFLLLLLLLSAPLPNPPRLSPCSFLFFSGLLWRETSPKKIITK